MIVIDHFPFSHVGWIESKRLNTYLETEEKIDRGNLICEIGYR